MDNYPWGAKDDPNAPWNEKESEMDCPDCYGTGEIPDSLTLGKPIDICDACNGTGKVTMTDKDYYDEYETAMEEKAEARREEQ